MTKIQEILIFRHLNFQRSIKQQKKNVQQGLEESRCKERISIFKIVVDQVMDKVFQYF